MSELFLFNVFVMIYQAVQWCASKIGYFVPHKICLCLMFKGSFTILFLDWMKLTGVFYLRLCSMLCFTWRGRWISTMILYFVVSVLAIIIDFIGDNTFIKFICITILLETLAFAVCIFAKHCEMLMDCSCIELETMLYDFFWILAVDVVMRQCCWFSPLYFMYMPLRVECHCCFFFLWWNND